MTTLSEQAARALSDELRTKFRIGEEGHVYSEDFEKSMLLAQDFATCAALALEKCFGVAAHTYGVTVYYGLQDCANEMYADHPSKQAAASVAVCRAIVAMIGGE